MFIIKIFPPKYKIGPREYFIGLKLLSGRFFIKNFPMTYLFIAVVVYLFIIGSVQY